MATGLHQAYDRPLPEDAAALYGPDGRHEEIAQGQAGTRGIAEGLRRFFEAFPDVRWEEREVVDGGDVAALTYVLTGTLQAELGPISARGQRLRMRGAFARMTL